MSVKCPNCEMKNAQIVTDEKGAHYTCPDCDFEWTGEIEDEEYDDAEEEDYDDTEDEEDYENAFNQAQYYAITAISDFLKELIKNFDEYNIEAEHLPVISNLYKVITNIKRYRVNGYLCFTVKDVESEGNFKYQEIQLDYDGLTLTRGGYVTEDDNGGDSYNTIIYPPDDEYEAMEIVTEIDNFISDFRDRLNNVEIEIEAIDSGDGIDEK